MHCSDRLCSLGSSHEGTLRQLLHPSYVPAGDVPTPFLDADDIADAAAAAVLTEDRHAGRLYELTGPRSLTFAEAAAEIAEATGREIRYVPVSLEEHAAEAAEHGVPAEVVELLTYLFSEVVDGRNANTTDGVRRALGREPNDFADYARDAATSGVWNARPYAAEAETMDGFLFAVRKRSCGRFSVGVFRNNRLQGLAHRVYERLASTCLGSPQQRLEL